MWFSRWFPLQKWTTCPWNIFHLQNNKCFCFCNTFTNVDWISGLKQTIVIDFTFVTKWSHPTCLTRAKSICVVTCLLTILRARKGTIIPIKPTFASWSIYNHVKWSTYKITFITGINFLRKVHSFLTAVTLRSHVSIPTTVWTYPTDMITGCVIYAVTAAFFPTARPKISRWAFYEN